MARTVAAVLIALLIWALLIGRIKANHQEYLPFAGQTWLMKIVIGTQGYTYCEDSRAASYPNFRAQLQDVVAQYAQRTGIKGVEVPFSDPSCEVQHVMLPEFNCGPGAAACVTYANKPVVINYQETLGFTSWASAQGHELGHAVLGNLNERYIDSGGSIQCGGPERGFTVMDCGPPYIAYPQAIDVQRGCIIIATSWCGAQTPPAPPELPYYDAARGCEFYGYWCYRFADGIWIDPQGVSEWDPPLPDGKVYNRRLLTWYWTHSTTWRNTGPDTWICEDFCF